MRVILVFVIAFVLGVFSEHNFALIKHVQVKCPQVKAACVCDKGCPGSKGGQCDCVAGQCNCEGKCTGKKALLTEANCGEKVCPKNGGNGPCKCLACFCVPAEDLK